MAEYCYNHGTVKVTTETTHVALMGGARNHSWLVYNSGPEMVYLGGDTVTADQEPTGGFPLKPGTWVPMPSFHIYADLYGVTAKGEAFISYIEPTG